MDIYVESGLGGEVIVLRLEEKELVPFSKAEEVGGPVSESLTPPESLGLVWDPDSRGYVASKAPGDSESVGTTQDDGIAHDESSAVCVPVSAIRAAFAKHKEIPDGLDKHLVTVLWEKDSASSSQEDLEAVQTLRSAETDVCPFPEEQMGGRLDGDCRVQVLLEAAALPVRRRVREFGQQDDLSDADSEEWSEDESDDEMYGPDFASAEEGGVQSSVAQETWIPFLRPTAQCYQLHCATSSRRMLQRTDFGVLWPTSIFPFSMSTPSPLPTVGLMGAGSANRTNIGTY